MATWCEELTHWKRPWCWERLRAGGEQDDKRWDGWMASPTQWTWVWASSRSWWWTEKPGALQSMGLQRVIHNWVTELNWIFFCEVSRSFAYFSMSWFILLLILKSSLHMLDNSPLPDVFYKYFLLGYGLSFNSLDIIFCKREFFNEFYLMNYLFHRLCLWC